MEQKRKFIRASYPCALTIWKKQMPVEVILAHTSNISAGGICVYLNHRLFAGTKVQLRVDLAKNKVVKCIGVVKRCDEDTDHFFKIAISFKELSGHDQMLIDAEVNAIIASQQKD